MRLSVRIDGNLQNLMAGERLAGERAVTLAMRNAATTLKANWRAQIAGAGLGTKLGRTVRSEVYPKGQASLRAASVVFTKAPHIVGAHERGTVVRSKSGLWLAIPTQAAGKGRFGGKITPAEWEQRHGRVLKLIYRRGRPGLLIDEGRKAPGNVLVRRRVRGGFALKDPVTFRNRTVPIFILVPQVRLRKRLNLIQAAAAVHAALPTAIVANWKGPTT